MINLFQPSFQQQWYSLLKGSNFKRYRLWHRIMAAVISLLIIFCHQAQQQVDIASATTTNQSISSTCVDLRTTVEFGYCTDKLGLN